MQQADKRHICSKEPLLAKLDRNNEGIGNTASLAWLGQAGATICGATVMVVPKIAALQYYYCIVDQSIWNS